MVVFLVLIVLDSFSMLSKDLAPQVWTVFQIGIGGYTIGRSGEKITKTFTTKFRRNNE